MENWRRHLGEPLHRAFMTVSETGMTIRATIKGGVINSGMSF